MKINTLPDIHELVICASILVVRDKKILMIRRSEEKVYLPGYVQPIGGKVDLNEDPLTAVRRELMEEAQIEVENLHLKAIVTEVKSKIDKEYSTNWQIFHFVGNYMEKKDNTIGKTEEGELVWLTLEEIKKEKIADSIRAIIEELLDKSSKLVFAKYTYNKGNKLEKKEIETI